MQMNEEGLALIRQFEGFRAQAYRDAVGVWTIGFGHTSMAGPPAVTRGMTVNQAEAETILARDVAQFAEALRKLITVELNDSQFSALVSFAYNVGIGNVRASSVLRAVNARDFGAVPRRLQLWTKAGGRVLPGLVRRRAAEAALFATGPVATDGGQPRPEPPAGKPLHHSTTVMAALVSLLAAFLAAVTCADVMIWLAFLLSAAAAVWIIRQRRQKSIHDGV